MTSLEKKLRALANGKDLPWDQTKALLEKLGAEVIPPRGGGSHFKIVCKGYSTRDTVQCTSLYTLHQKNLCTSNCKFIERFSERLR